MHVLGIECANKWVHKVQVRRKRVYAELHFERVKKMVSEVYSERLEHSTVHKGQAGNRSTPQA